MRIGIVGDLILSDRMKIDPGLLDILRNTDLNIANLEAPFIRKGMKPVLAAGLHQLTGDCRLLHQMNIRAVSMANNHMCDFGSEGIRFTQQVLDEQGIAHFGAGNNLEEARRPALLTIRNRKVALWGFMQRYASGRHFATSSSAGVAELRKDLVLKTLNESRADVKIIYNHWNQEFEHFPEPFNKLLAEEVARHCQLVIGSHSHCLQGIQPAGQSRIFYSLGNFSMPAMEYAGTRLIKYPGVSRDSMIVELTLHKDDMEYTVHPIQLDENGCLVTVPTEGEADRIRKQLQLISGALQMDYAQYRKFYKKHKQRKLLPTQVRNPYLNRLRLWFFYKADGLVRYSEIKLARILKHMGLLNYMKRRMSRILDYLHTNR